VPTELEVTRACHELVDFAASTDRRDELARGMLALLQRHIGFDAAAILRITDAEWYCYQKPAVSPERASVYNGEAMLMAGVSQRHGWVMLDNDVLPVRERERLHVYDEHLRPLGARSIAGVFIHRHGAVTSIFGLGRYGRARFDDGQLNWLKALQPTLTLLMDRDEALKRTGTPLEVFPELSRREREVVEYVGRGLQNREIAALLGTSRHTVRNQLAQVYRKLEVTNRTELVRRAVEKWAVRRLTLRARNGSSVPWSARRHRSECPSDGGTDE